MPTPLLLRFAGLSRCRRPGRLAVLAACLSGAWVWMPAPALAAPGGTVYRCADNQFSQTPCAGGRALALEPPPDAARLQEAQAVARREKAALRRMAHERHAQERAAQHAPAPMAAIQATPKQEAASAASSAAGKGRKRLRVGQGRP